MKILKYTTLVISLAFASSIISSCNKEKVEKVMIGSYVPLQAELSSDITLPGDDLSYSISVVDPSNSGITMNEDIDVQLTYTIISGTKTNISPSEVFDNPPMSVHLKRGIRAEYTHLKVKENISLSYPISVSIKAFSRGYQINGSTKILSIIDKLHTKVAIAGSSDNTIDEGGRFVLSFTLPRPAMENVVIDVTPKAGDDAKFINLPSSVTIKKGFTSSESNVVTIIAKTGDNGFDTATLDFSTNSAEYPLLNTSLVINVNDLDGDLDPSHKLTDERWVYPNPNQVFMSKKNEVAVEKWGKTKSLRLIMPGDPHPNLGIASKGWKLINSMEFTPIPSLIQGGKENKWKNRPSAFFAAQNVVNTQKIQAVDNDKYSTLTDEGYLMLWSAHDEGIVASGGAQGQVKNYGSAAFYQNKYNGGDRDSWNSSQVMILPGTRVEARIRMRGQLWGFNPALWLQGNMASTDKWSYYGEVDILEAPFFWNGGTGAWQTFHWNDNKTTSGDRWAPSSGSKKLDLSNFNIYWVEWRSNDEIAMGINGQQTNVIHNSSKYSWWPFTDTYNKNGMHLLITFVANNSWSMRGYTGNDWDKNLLNIPYEGSKTNPNTPRMEIDWIRYYKTDIYRYDPFANGKSYMY